MERRPLRQSGPYGFLTVACGRRIGVRSWYDSSGTLHAACAGHVVARMNRYPPSDPPRPTFFHEEQDAIDAAKWEEDRIGAAYVGSWTEA